MKQSKTEFEMQFHTDQEHVITKIYELLLKFKMEQQVKNV